METMIAPGEETHDHSHPLEAAYIVLTDSELRITYDDHSSAEATLRRGDVGFGDSAIVHRVANIGDTTARVLTVEIFSQPPRLNPDVPLTMVGEILIDNDKVIVTRIHIPQGELLSLPREYHAVIIPARRGSLKTGNRTLSIDPGKPHWHEADTSEYQNVGDSPFEAYLVAIKPRT